MSDPQQANSTRPNEEQDPGCDQGAYREVVELAKSLGYEDWELLEAIDCSGLKATLNYLRGEAGLRRRPLN